MEIKTLGYNPSFLGEPLPLPDFDQSNCVPLKNSVGYEICYTHFSIFQHKVRKLPLLAAVNISGAAYSAQSRLGGDAWKYCDQIHEKYQIDNSLYGHDLQTFDRGHIIRRVDPCWGDLKTSTQADKDTFNWANCTPQHKLLNQRSGIWFQLEQHIMEKGVRNEVADICVFAGPVLDKKDLNFIKPYRDSPLQVPAMFWKVIVWKKRDGKLYAVGFMMSQWQFIKDKMLNGDIMTKAILQPKKRLPDDYFETLKFSDNNTYQVNISEIEKATSITFSWKNVNFPYRGAKAKIIKAEELSTPESYPKNFTPKLSRAQKDLIPQLPKSKSGEFTPEDNSLLAKQYKIKNISL
jgi:endonuclease G